jgi:hypothetical protein
MCLSPRIPREDDTKSLLGLVKLATALTKQLTRVPALRGIYRDVCSAAGF